MCGIVGIWQTTGLPVFTEAVLRATRVLQHRGPDDEGFFFSNTTTGAWSEATYTDARTWDMAFGFRRLAILDLSQAGHQPMRSRDGLSWIVFNGEIYNFIELRKELQQQGIEFQTGTDTEVVLAAFQVWGERCLERFNGMWAFAIWNSTKKTLFCSRDRFGIKPFYYCWKAGLFAFASEIKALLMLTPLAKKPNDPLIYDYLSCNLLDHTEETFFKDILQLPAGHTLTIKNGNISIRRYWDLDFSNKGDLETDATYSRDFKELLEDAVKSTCAATWQLALV